MLDGWLGMAVIMTTTVGIPMFVAMCPLAGWTMVVLAVLLLVLTFFFKTGIILSMIVILWRMWLSMPSSEEVWSATQQPRSRILVILGNGDHTAEMLYDIGTVDDWRDKFEATYITADTDKKSQAFANTFENDIRGRDATVKSIPRGREVGQSFTSSIPSMLWAILVACKTVFAVWPDAVVCNGPGICVPAVYAAYVPRFFCWKRIAIIYTESISNIDKLSNTGGTLYQLSDVFIVQWDPLYRHCCSLQFKYGHLLHGGRCRDGEKLKALPVDAQKGDDTAIVTVGNTPFDELIRAVDTEDFVQALVALSIKRVKVQKGDGLWEPVVMCDAAREAGIEVDLVTYSPTLPEELQAASLVVSHAGAGTVLDCLNHSRRMLIVPNEELTDSQEVKLCEELKMYGLVRWSRCSDIAKTLAGYTGSDLKKFPEEPTPTFASVLRQLCGRPNKEEKEERRKSRQQNDRHGYDRYDRY